MVQSDPTRWCIHAAFSRTDDPGVTITWPAPQHSPPPAPSPMSLLEGGIPLSLLLDLMCGPQSQDLLDNEPQPNSET
jgi:hypothetical protein